MLRQFRIASVLLAAALVSTGCGIKGPLVLPPAKPATAIAPATESAPATPAPAPATPPLTAPGTAPAGERKP